MSQTLLRVNGLKTWIDTSQGTLRAVDGISFEIARGETFALLGESGSGKSMTALSLIGLVPQPAGRIVAGNIFLDGEDLTTYSEVALREVRGKRIAMIFQEPMTSLNPVLTVGEQIRESVRRHLGLKGLALKQRVIELLNDVGIPDPARRVEEYPHQLSGGMKQRVMIAIALAGGPDLLIADEPTTALDVTIQAQVLQLLRELQKRTGMAILLITHDLGVVYEMADRIAVMYAGLIVEQASRKLFFSTPKHPYSRRLFKSLPNMAKRHQMLEAIAGSVPPLTQDFIGCRFEPRCTLALGHCASLLPPEVTDATGHGVACHLYSDSTFVWNDEVAAPAVATSAPPESGKALERLLTVRDLRVHFPIRRGLFQTARGFVYAVDGVQLNIAKGRALALVGESGCGKTTVGKSILQLLPEYSRGEVELNGSQLSALTGETLRRKRADFQIIFQDPYSSMNPRMRVGDIIEEGMVALNIYPTPQARAVRVAELLSQVGLRPDMSHRYPHEFSGGQRQRICIARALAVNPKLIVCDEPTSALDVSVQAQILNLLKDLQQKLGLAYLFITHNLSVVAYLADDIAVMYLGRIVEEGPVEDVLKNPKHPYTQALLAAVPEINRNRERLILKGDLPSPSHPPKGCHFHPRCSQALDKCRVTYPESSGKTHRTHCHLYG